MTECGVLFVPFPGCPFPPKVTPEGQGMPSQIVSDTAQLYGNIGLYPTPLKGRNSFCSPRALFKPKAMTLLNTICFNNSALCTHILISTAMDAFSRFLMKAEILRLPNRRLQNTHKCFGGEGSALSHFCFVFTLQIIFLF